MKANFRKLEKPTESAFHIKKDVRTSFDDKWHFHEMLELVVILKGSGKRFVGDSIETFSKGDVILVGKKLPHVWRSNPQKKKNSLKMKCSSIIIQFSPDFLGTTFLNLSESDKLKKLFKNAEMGISFQNETRKKLIEKIKRLIELEGMERLLFFLDILHFSSKSEEYSLLASPLFKETIFKSDLKINNVFEYIMDNFSNSITLDEVAQVASMNKTAFCRYFKKRTKKTFSSFLNEIRIGYACKLIREEKYNITEAAYLSGYNSPSHFNKQFRLIKKTSPTEFYKNSQGI
ncbi:AraC family transcriptional regulator [Polaribacter sp. NJDZ03]|uniref:AraC family transcriptional regulator n=1 Tax=Polaribacter sp. NJDZ03 TaxID=2855841 RepID=UPI001C4A6ADB|nr:AraC family transcriptional regulator [Polaribacter sp. NJDZ03]